MNAEWKERIEKMIAFDKNGGKTKFLTGVLMQGILQPEWNIPTANQMPLLMRFWDSYQRKQEEIRRIELANILGE